MSNDIEPQEEFNINDISSISLIDANDSLEQTFGSDSNIDSSFLDETIEIEPDFSEFIHPNLSCTVNDAMTIIYAFFIRHGLSWEGIEDLARLVNAIVGTDMVATTKYKFKQKFQKKEETRPIIHFLCDSCGMYLGTKDSIQTSELTTCLNCRTEICMDTKYKKNHFVSIPIERHLKSVLQRNSEHINLDMSSLSSSMCDVHDSKHFRKLRNELPDSLCITLTFSTDGAAVFKNTKDKSFWPIQFLINEIDLNHRFDRHNILCSAFAFGKTPNMQSFFKPLIQEINVLNE